MDMLAVDLTPLRAAGMEVGMGSEVTLWGGLQPGRRAAH
jgi:alanine racemase